MPHANMPEITELQENLIETEDRVGPRRTGASGRFDFVLMALCCLGFLIYLFESESIHYLISHIGRGR